MLADHFNERADSAASKVVLFEKQVKEQFVNNPGQMRPLIVVDMLLTGFDAPSATYLYIDKTMQDHGLFQAICRVNRLDGDDKDCGYIVDYRDLFNSLIRIVNPARKLIPRFLAGTIQDRILGRTQVRIGELPSIPAVSTVLPPH